MGNEDYESLGNPKGTFLLRNRRHFRVLGDYPMSRGNKSAVCGINARDWHCRFDLG